MSLPTPVPEQIKRLEKRYGGKWVTLKEWLCDQADKFGITYYGAFARYERGLIKPTRMVKSNSRVIFVRVKKWKAR